MTDKEKYTHDFEKPIVYIDMDNVLVDFQSGIDKLTFANKQKYAGNYHKVPHIFRLMKPIDGAIDAVHQLAEQYEVFVLSTAPWANPTAWHDKVLWIQKYFGYQKDSVLFKRLILSHYKNLNQGAYLIDDRTCNGASRFAGEHIVFGSEQFPDWNSVLAYLLKSTRVSQ